MKKSFVASCAMLWPSCTFPLLYCISTCSGRGIGLQLNRGMSLAFAPDCHLERREGTARWAARSFASLRMTELSLVTTISLSCWIGGPGTCRLLLQTEQGLKCPLLLWLDGSG